MKEFIVTIFILTSMMYTATLYDFNNEVPDNDWRVINDGVMGGLSKGEFSVNAAGHGFFHGQVSLEKNGGFSSVRHRLDLFDTSNFSQFKLRLKGDGKTYQFRVKADVTQRHSYIGKMQTSGDWEIITIQFSDMYPAFRGRLLDLPNYSGETISEIAFLIGNKKKETFALEIDYIKLE